MRVLITGAAGFTGGHLADHLAAAGHVVTGIGHATKRPLRPSVTTYVTVALEDVGRVRRVMADQEPEAVFHLAANASVRASWEAPTATLRNNLDSTVGLLEAVRAEVARARIVLVGSGEQYGPPRYLPIDEAHPLRPQNPYAVSKTAADILGGFYADAHGLHVIRARAFNHFGPGQRDLYVVSAFARQIADAERRGAASVTVKTGELASRRDFTDVRDVVRAYAALIEQADPGPYNVCSGISRSAADILAALAAESTIQVEHEVDASRLRKNEVREIRGSCERLKELTGWEPEIPFATTIRDTLDWWRRQ